SRSSRTSARGQAVPRPGEEPAALTIPMMREGWIERSGVRLHYLEWEPEGDRQQPDLFMLHGLSSNSRLWERLAALLPGRRMVALDQRSHGPSARPAEGY